MYLNETIQLKFLNQKAFFNCRLSIKPLPIDPLRYYKALAFDFELVKFAYQFNNHEMAVWSAMVTCAWSTKANNKAFDKSHYWIINIQQISEVLGMDELDFCILMRTMERKGAISFLKNTTSLLRYGQGFLYFAIRIMPFKTQANTLPFIKLIDRYAVPYYMYEGVDLGSYLV